MRKVFFFLLLLFASPVFAQKKISIAPGLGFGGVVGETNTLLNSQKVKGSPYITAFISAYYLINENISTGIQLLTGGELISTDGKAFNTTTNTTTVSGNSLPAASILLRGRYTFLSQEQNIRPFIDLGLGVTTYTYKSITQDVNKVSKKKFAISPEFGLAIGRLNLSCIAIFGGETPTFSGFDRFSNSNITLNSTKSQQIYFTASYRLLSF